MRRIFHGPQALAGVIALLAFGASAVAADRPYTEGSVFNVTAVRTEPGMFEDYMAWLAGPWQDYMEELKKAGIILSYEVDMAMPRSPGDPDLYLITEYRNMAALDNLDARSDPISERIFGNMQKANSDSIARGKMRTVLGDELVRKLVLK